MKNWNRAFERLGFKKKAVLSDRNQSLTPEEMEFLPAALEVVEMPPSPIGRAIIWMVIILFVIALIWSIVGQIDEVAVAQGKVIPTGYTKTIQAEDKGVVKAIHVKDGSKVRAGDVLVELDTTFTAADLANLTKEKAYLQLEINRLMAEKGNASFNPTIDQGASEQEIQLQKLLYQSRMEEYQTKAAAAQQAVEQARAALYVNQSTKEKLAQQLEIALYKDEQMQKLFDQGVISVFACQDAKEKRVTIQQDLAAQANEVVKANSALLQSIETLNNIHKERDKDIMTTLVEDHNKLKSVEEEFKKAEEKKRLCTITAPIDGTVQQLELHTIGGIVTAAQPLMLIVPDGTKMEMEVWVNNKDIGFVHVGQDAELKVETFNFQKFGTLKAKLAEISSDAIEDKEKDKGLVYRALCNSEQNYIMVGDEKVYLSPGMAVTAEIKTRKKRIIEYFLDPFITYKSEGLRER